MPSPRAIWQQGLRYVVGAVAAAAAAVVAAAAAAAAVVNYIAMLAVYLFGELSCALACHSMLRAYVRAPALLVSFLLLCKH